MKTPSIGRIVHYVADDVHLPAVVTKVWSEQTVNLFVFPNGSEVVGSGFVKTSVVFSDTGQKAGSWHWPEVIGEVQGEESALAHGE